MRPWRIAPNEWERADYRAAAAVAAVDIPVSPDDPHAPYTVYKADVSYFSGKLEAYLRYKGIDHRPVEVDARIMNREVFPAVGVKKVPVVRTSDGLWLYDTTPCIAWFEARYPAHPVLPEDPALRFIALLIEDYADEWLWRPAMWWRWEPVVSRLALGRAIAELGLFPGMPKGLAGRLFASRQRHLWLWGDGVNRSNAPAVRQLYLDELAVLEPVLRRQPYLLGAQPSVADFGYFASMFRHFGNDPDPAELMRREAPAVYAWTARLWNARADASDATAVWGWPDAPDWAPLWNRIVGDYLPYLHQNALAYRAGRKRFDFTGRSLNFAGTVTDHYRVWCRQALQRRHGELDANARTRVAQLLAPAGGPDALLADGEIDAGLDKRYRLPQPAGRYRQSWLSLLLGQPRNVSRRD